MEQLSVLIVDEHPIIIDGLLLFLNKYPDISIVGAASDGREGLAQLRRLHPDCMIVDSNQPKLHGAETIRRYLRERPDLGIIVYTEYTDEILVNEALQAGVRAYISKSAPVADLACALRETRRKGN
ncbi:MAG: response regulator transcription factor [Desulfuromonadales bacterium]|nr:response regulator transcription factor [Desulfuromonadales bacterium]